MAGSLLKNRELILAKIETTENTDAVPVAGVDAVLVEEASWSLEGLRMVDRPVVKPNLSKEQQTFAGALRKVTFSCEIKGSGAAGTAPEIGPLLRACAMGETIVASTSVTYGLVSTGHETITIYYFQDGLRYILTGCRGNVNYSIEAGSKLMANFEFTGHSVAPTDVTLPAATYDATVPVGLIGVPFTANGYGAVINNLTVDLGNAIATTQDISSVDGYGCILITGRDVQGSFDPEHTLAATQDWESALRAGTLVALTTGVIGSVAGNRVQFDLDKCYYRNITPADRDAVRTLDIPFGCTENAGEDELTMVFT